MSDSRYKPWIDWMKVLGMGLIIFGHTGGQALIQGFTFPINIKQLGVAFFVFITGYTLATEWRRPLHAVYHRYFDVFYFALMMALLMSLVMFFVDGDLNESNYLPLVLGVNVLDNAFPANPTSWYVGCYLHILIVWAMVFRRLPLNWKSFTVILIVELAVRTGLLVAGRDFTAYMLVTNWLLVFTAGLWLGGRQLQAENLATGKLTTVNLAAGERAARGERSAGPQLTSWLGSSWTKAAVGLLGVTALAVASYFLVVRLGISGSNPFGRIPVPNQVGSALVTSANVSLQYLLYTVGAFYIFQVFPKLAVIRFLAMNTLIVFLAHMPLEYVIDSRLHELIPQTQLRVVCNQLIYFGLLAVVSSMVVRVSRPGQVKAWMGEKLFSLAAQPASSDNEGPQPSRTQLRPSDL